MRLGESSQGKTQPGDLLAALQSMVEVWVTNIGDQHSSGKLKQSLMLLAELK